MAAEHGAVGCLIYSDPRDDGYYQGDAYPKGGFRPAYGAQRGSVMDAPVYPGDPLTPGVGATKDAQRLPREKAETITKIPVLPISYADATPLLKRWEGQLRRRRFASVAAHVSSRSRVPRWCIWKFSSIGSSRPPMM